MNIERNMDIKQGTESGVEDVLGAIRKLLSEYKEKRQKNDSTTDKIMERLTQVLEVELNSIKSKGDMLPDKQPHLHELLQAMDFYNTGTEEGIKTAFDIIGELLRGMGDFVRSA